MYFEVLKEVANRLNKTGCQWAVGGSLVLYFNGIWDCPNDIDILINSKEIECVKEVMVGLEKEKHIKSKGQFTTEDFLRYKVNGIEVEIMANFAIKVDEDKEYKFILDSKSIVNKVDMAGTLVNVTSLEDWMIAYLAMGDPKKRVPIIEEYFKKNGVVHRELLERNLQGGLSDNIKLKVTEVLEKY